MTTPDPDVLPCDTEQKTTWQNISTAPQHYEHDILVYDPGMRVSGPFFVSCYSRELGWVLSADGRTKLNPTKWQPIPVLPTDEDT